MSLSPYFSYSVSKPLLGIVFCEKPLGNVTFIIWLHQTTLNYDGRKPWDKHYTIIYVTQTESYWETRVSLLATPRACLFTRIECVNFVCRDKWNKCISIYHNYIHISQQRGFDTFKTNDLNCNSMKICSIVVKEATRSFPHEDTLWRIVCLSVRQKLDRYQIK